MPDARFIEAGSWGSLEDWLLISNTPTGVRHLSRRDMRGWSAFPTLSTSLATLTLTQSSASGIAGSVLVQPWETIAFTYDGVVPAYDAGLVDTYGGVVGGGVGNVYPSGNTSGTPWAVEFDLDTSDGLFEVKFLGKGAGGEIRVLVNGKRVSLRHTFAPAADGLNYFGLVNLGGAGIYRIRLEFGPSARFRGIQTLPANNLSAAPKRPQRWIVVGDSFVEPTISDPQTTLSAATTSGDTVVNVASVANFSAAGQFILGDSIVTYTALAAARTVADAVTNATTTVTSATANFAAGDVGKLVTGTNIPAATRIQSVTNATTAVLTQAATGSATGSLTINAAFTGGTNTPTAASGATVGGYSYWDGWVQTLGYLLNVDVWSAGKGGTGYLNPGTFVKFRDRLAADVFPNNPDVIVFAGGINDYANYTAPQIQAEALACFQAAKAALPGVRLVVLSPFWRNGFSTYPTNLIAAADAIKAATQDATVSAFSTFVDVLRLPVPPNGANGGPTLASTTLQAATNVGASTITTGVKYPTGTYIQIGNDANAEIRKVTGTAGAAAPFTLSFNTGGGNLARTHNAGDPITPVGQGVYTGTGRVGATVGDGNSDRYNGIDTTHPTRLGHLNLGRMIFELIVAASNG